MIFKQVMVDQILAGDKTMTRRPVKDDLPCRYAVGNTYSVQPDRGMKGVARIRVLAVRRERWFEITEEDAMAEGFRAGYVPEGDREVWRTARAQFFTYLRGLYMRLVWDAECWVIEFELAEVGS